MANTKKYVSFDKLGLYDEKIKKVIADGDQASLDSAKAYAKEYADGLATNYDVAGSAATVQGNLDAEILRAKAAEEANAAAAKKAQNEVDALELVVDEIQRNAYNDTELRGLITGLQNSKADKDQVATDIATAVKVETDARVEAVKGVQDAVDALSGTHATDKTALEGAIAAKADQTALDAVSEVANAAVKQADYDVKVKALEDEDARIEGLVTAEAAKAREEEGKLDARLVEVETFFKTAEGETIDQAMDTLVEIQKYITEDGSAADQMVKDIAANKKAIEDHVATDHDFAAADEDLRADLEAEIEKKASQNDFNTLKGRVDGIDESIEALEGADEDQVERIAALEDKFGEGEGSVADMIADAVKVEEEARKAADSAIEAKADQGIADAAAALKAAQNASAHADELNTAMDARMQVVEAKAHEHANKALLDTYTQTEENLADAVAKKHEHANKTVLDGITAEKVAAWDAAEGNAKTFAQGLNDAMDTRVATLETWHENFVECSQEDINGLFA